VPPVRSLSFHAAYRCQHAGACCSSNWPIPIEADRLLTLRRALAEGTLAAPRAEVGPRTQLIVDGSCASDQDGPPAVLGRTAGHCVFHDADDRASSPQSGRCHIHAALGHDRLPLACRQFPRVTVKDQRGVSVTLSHYCPTAAGLLERDPQARFAIVTDPPAFPESGEYVGLDAGDGLPPLLRPGMLMDWDAWWECERMAVDVCAGSADAAAALARLRGVVADLETWRPDDGPLLDRVRAAFRNVASLPSRIPEARILAAVLDAIPEEIRPTPSPSSPLRSDGVLRRLLAAHAFGSWHIYYGTGLRTWLHGLEAVAALIAAGSSVRETDLKIRHLADSERLSDRLATLR
jgi:Fe-S-cluster containining protein